MALVANPETIALSRERAELILGHLDQLPPLPAVVARLLSVTADDGCSARDVVRVLETDSSLTASILRLAQRADLGVARQGLTISRAVTALGQRMIRNAVVAAGMQVGLPSHPIPTTTGDARTELWKHNLAVACCAQALAEKSHPPVDGGEAFVCGLLHDIGKIALGACLPKSYARVLDECERQFSCICDVERRLLGLDHTVAGKRLLTRWRLPQYIWECAWLHHQDPDSLPSTVQHRALVALVHLADNLVRWQRIGFSGYQHIADLDACGRRFGLLRADLDDCAASLPARMEPLLSLIGLEREDRDHLHLESLAKANAELLQANARLADTNDRLSARSKAFELLSEFGQRISEQDQVGDVCAVAADCLRRSLGCHCALVLGAAPVEGCCYVGRSEADAGGQTVNPCGIVEASLSAFGPFESNRPTLADQHARLLWSDQFDRRGVEALLVLPLRVAGELVGVVLFERIAVTDDDAATAADNGWVHRDEARWSEEWDAISSAFGLAIANARARAGAELLSDELLELNRRIRAAEAELLRSRSLSMIAKMAGGAAHELNTPLSVISGRAQMLQSRITEEDARQWLTVIEEQSHIASGIVTELMDFAKPATPAPADIALTRLLTSLHQRWHPRFQQAELNLHIVPADETLTIHADESHVHQILDAVIANALQVLPPETGTLQVNSPSRETDEKLRIVCQDNGPGMSRDVLEHAIDPFFSHRPAGRGRGLGLSKAHRLAELNGGTIWIQSTQHKGTTVTIELPASARNSPH